MKVKCITNAVHSLNKEIKKRLAQEINLDGVVEELLIGKEYLVEGIINNGGWHYYIHADEDLVFPTRFPAEFFHIIDSSLPKGWGVRMHNSTVGTQIELMSFAAWVNDITFYEALVEEEATTVKVYNKYRQS